MREVETKDLTPQMVTAAPIKTHNGQIIIDAQTPLTEQLISRIQFYNIEYIMVQDDQPVKQEAAPEPAPEPKPEPKPAPQPVPAPQPEPKPAPQEPVKAQEPEKKPEQPRKSRTYSQAVKESPEFKNFQVDFAVCRNELKEYFDALVGGNYKNPETLIAHTISLIKKGQTSIEFFDMLHNLRSVDDGVYAHCLNVALISRMIGKWLKLPEDKLTTLTLAGLLHDIGKCKIPPEVLNKQGKLTDEEFELLRSHSQLGYEILKPLPLSSHVKKAALMHHERCDGSGYPSNLKADDIDNYALVIAIADVYDAMTAARAYRAPLCPFQVIAEFEKEGLSKYKPKFILTFLQKIASTYQSNHVLLSDGRAANIVLLNQNHLSKPLVQLDSGECIDLARSQLYINAII